MRKQVDPVNHKPNLPEEVMEAVHTVMHLFRARQFRTLKDGAHELSHMEAKVLGFFAAHPSATQRELVQHTGRDKGQIARLIAGLRERGLLDASADESDKRSTRLSVSAQGQSLQAAVRREGQALSAQALAGVNAAEQRQLLALLSTVRDSLERE